VISQRVGNDSKRQEILLKLSWAARNRTEDGSAHFSSRATRRIL